MYKIENIQYTQFLILKEIVRICSDHNIPYFLCCGTLLGAIRHKGPIPWDDDLDVGFLRENYDIFLRVADKELNKDFFLQTWDTDSGYALPHCKIRDKNSHYIETVSKLSGCCDGISVDVLPFDTVPQNCIMRYIHCYYLFDILNLIKIKRKWTFIEENRVPLWRKCVYKVLNSFTDERKLISKYEKMQKKYNGTRSKLISETAGLDYFRFVEKREYYEEIIEGEYNNLKISIPKYFHEILWHTYGDYMKIPSEKQRTGQPGIEEVKFKDEVEL